MSAGSCASTAPASSCQQAPLGLCTVSATTSCLCSLQGRSQAAIMPTPSVCSPSSADTPSAAHGASVTVGSASFQLPGPFPHARSLCTPARRSAGSREKRPLSLPRLRPLLWIPFRSACTSWAPASCFCPPPTGSPLFADKGSQVFTLLMWHRC